MSAISLLLQNVHESVHDFKMKPRFSEPKLYTGGVDISKWSRLTRKEQQAALAADWYIRYSFEEPVSGRLKRQPNIKAGGNRFKTKKERFQFLETMRNNLSLLLASGFNPYENNDLKKQEFVELNMQASNGVVKATVSTTKPTVTTDHDVDVSIDLEKAFKIVEDTKKRMLADTSYSRYKSRVNRFKVWLLAKGYKLTGPIDAIDKKTIISYLNEVLQLTSARNRNNTRTDISSFFQVLEDNDIIKDNFVKRINVLKSNPTRNKTYTPKQEDQLLEYLESNDATLLLFVKFISYNFLRPIEVCRLKIGDVDMVNKKLYFRAKNKPVKVKIIPEILWKDIPDLSKIDPEHYLFTPFGIGMEWSGSDSNKRDYFSKQFKKVKDHFGLSHDYGLYSFRHTYITKLYREIRKAMTPYESKSKLMLITGHTSMSSLEKYLRDIDAELPEDYSEYIK
ncbi:tyrosine-type recombinase/integrase [Psychroserpens sp. Hel_I_66]|uniref:tyrosine-type recombinase/integrase n=1 Tax=Psychroserpens sp. Hel_I_66 TaxID=1250004 RepID=UPI00064602A1|nr:tyrosine-type recombinase/integrase [Psychroserpens sp. Hel_I_66]